MFDRFNDTARRVVARSGDEARAIGYPHISTTHLLLALLNTTTADGAPNKAADIIQDITDLAGLREQILAPMPTSTKRSEAIHLPFTDDMKLALDASVRAVDKLGDNHIGPEHLLAGLAEVSDSTRSGILRAMGLTLENVLALIKHSVPVVRPTRARSYAVYLATGAALDPRNPQLYPSLELAQAVSPSEDVAAFRLPIHEGEFFQVSTSGSAADIEASFASYQDAFTIAEGLKEAGMNPSISILSPRVKELHGKDSRGHDVVLGKAVEYTSSRPVSRIIAITPTHKESTHV